MWSGFEERSMQCLENDLFRNMLKMGHAFLRELITLRGTGKAERAVRVGRVIGGLKQILTKQEL